MIPIPALYVAQFVLMNDLGWINTWAGIIAPQLIVPVVIIVYKQFFDAVPKEMREAVVLDGGGEYTLLFKRLPAAQLGHHHGARDHHLHRRLEQLLVAVPRRHLRGHDDDPGRHHPGATTSSASPTPGIMAAALLAALPVVVAYLIFQRRVTEAVMISSGVKG